MFKSEPLHCLWPFICMVESKMIKWCDLLTHSRTHRHCLSYIEYKDWESKCFLTLAPIWLPHWPAWMWTISLMVAAVVASEAGAVVMRTPALRLQNLASVTWPLGWLATGSPLIGQLLSTLGSDWLRQPLVTGSGSRPATALWES